MYSGVGPAFPAPRIHPVPDSNKILTPRRNETETTWMDKPAFEWMLVPGIHLLLLFIIQIAHCWLASKMELWVYIILVI